MNLRLLLLCCGLGWLAACSTPDTPATAPPVQAPPPDKPPHGLVSWPEQLHLDYQRLMADRRRVRAADSVMVADHQTARAVARDAGLAATLAFQELEKRHLTLLARHQQALQWHNNLLRSYAELGYFSATDARPVGRLRTIHDSLWTEHQRLETEYRRILADHQQMQADHAALLDTTQ